MQGSGAGQWRYWAAAGAGLLAVLWLLGDAILPFAVGAAIAYLLDPLAKRLQRLGLSRLLATVTITLAVVLVLVLAVVLVIPTLVKQTQALVVVAPEALERLGGILSERFPGLMDEASSLRQGLAALVEAGREHSGEVLGRLLATASSVVTVVVLFVVAPVVAFYLLLDWDRMVAAADAMLPRAHAPTIRRLAGEVDRTLAGFVRGQGSVCLILGTFYAVALSLAGLQFGLAIGAVAGFLTFIPYVGAIVGGTLAIGFALFQFWGDWHMIALVAGIFVGGQMVESNVLTPRLVGGSVGLHPVWLLFALASFGTLFGFVGLLVAVPVAAMLGVLVRFGAERYRASALYLGDDGDDPPEGGGSGSGRGGG